MTLFTLLLYAAAVMAFFAGYWFGCCVGQSQERERCVGIALWHLHRAEQSQLPGVVGIAQLIVREIRGGAEMDVPAGAEERRGLI